MEKGRSYRTRSMGGTKSKGGGRLQKHKDGHAVPGQNMSDSKPSTWPARTGYTSQSRMGPGKHGTNVTVK